MARGSYARPVNIQPVVFPKYSGPKLVPMGETVHVQLDHSPERSATGIVVFAADKKRTQVAQALVLNVGPEVADVVPGDVVLVAQHMGSGNDGRVRPDGTMLIHKSFVLAIVEP